MRTLQPPGWPRPRGYANGVAARGTLVFVAGQIGWHPDGSFPAGGFPAQVDQALANVMTVLAEAGAGPEHIARMTWYVTDKRLYLDSLAAVGPSFKARMSGHYPAMTAVEVTALVEDEALIEIEVTAVVPDP